MSAEVAPRRAAGTKVPVTILTGFLGSGKTTLMNHILRDSDHGMKFAVIENEFGEVGIDQDIVALKGDADDEEIIEMMNGCICCNVRGDLIPVIKKILLRKDNFDAILIETTGLADPAPVIQTFFMDEEIKAQVELDGVITVVDAKHIVMHLEEEKPDNAGNEAVEQLAFADRILLNKTDLVRPAELGTVHEAIKAINTSAKVIETQYSKVDPMQLIGIKGFDLDRVLEMEPEFLNPDADGPCTDEHCEDDGHDHSHHGHHGHHGHGHDGHKDEGHDHDGHGHDGHEDDGHEDDGHGHHGHGHDGHKDEEHGHDGHKDEGGHGHDGQHDDHKDKGSAAAVKKPHKGGYKHKHDSRVSSISFQFEGDIVVSQLERLISILIKEKGKDLYRYKGVLAVAGKEEKFVFQGVHMVFDCKFLNKWAEGETRQSKFVFIGKDLNKENISGAFEACKAAELRFKIGDKVQANVGKFTDAEVVAIWDDGNPYRVRLDGKETEVWAPQDNDMFIRKRRD